MEYLTSFFSVALLASAIRVTMPILLASLGAVHAERGGVVNIGLEGIMIMGTFFGAVGAYAFDTRFPSLAQTWPNLAPLAGVLAAVAAGPLFRPIPPPLANTFPRDPNNNRGAPHPPGRGVTPFFHHLLLRENHPAPRLRGV